MDKKANKTTKSQPRKPKFIAYANREADRKRAMGRIGVANNYVCAARRFQAFLASRGKKDVPFKKMNPLLMADFQEWLHVQGCQRNTSATTAHRNNVSLPIISQALGHDSEKTTAIYLKSFETDTINAANHTLLDNVFGDKTC